MSDIMKVAYPRTTSFLRFRDFSPDYEVRVHIEAQFPGVFVNEYGPRKHQGDWLLYGGVEPRQKHALYVHLSSAYALGTTRNTS
jgi:hypothetical protein